MSKTNLMFLLLEKVKIANTSFHFALIVSIHVLISSINVCSSNNNNDDDNDYDNNNDNDNNNNNNNDDDDDINNNDEL